MSTVPAVLRNNSLDSIAKIDEYLKQIDEFFIANRHSQMNNRDLAILELNLEVIRMKRRIMVLEDEIKEKSDKKRLLYCTFDGKTLTSEKKLELKQLFDSFDGDELTAEILKRGFVIEKDYRR